MPQDNLRIKLEKIPTSKNATIIEEFLISNPKFTLLELCNKTLITKRTALRILNFLLQQKIIRSQSENKIKTYFLIDYK